MSTEWSHEPPASSSSSNAPGQELKAAREALGWSVEQLADQLKLHPRQVVAIEEGDYAALPPAAVTRGFVRLYARAVKLDPAPLVARLPVDAAAAAADASVQMRRDKPASFTETRYPSNGKRTRVPVLPLLLVLAAAAGAGAAWHFGLFPGHGDGAPRGETVITPTVPPASQTGVAAPAAPPASAPAAAGTEGSVLQNPSVPLISVPPPAGTTPDTAPSVQGAGPAPAAPAGTAPGMPAAPAPGPAAAPPANPAATANPAAAANPVGADTLVLNVKQDSWIDVRPEAGGVPLISRLVKGGSTESLRVSGPVRLTVGNPGGVEATLRGAAVALPNVKGRIARVNLK